MKFVSLLLLFALLISCSDLKKPDQLARAESILKDLTDLENELNAFVLDSIEKQSEENTQIILALKEFETDTISVEMAKKMNRFQRLHETIPVAIELREQLRAALIEMRADLAKLKRDISAGNGKRDRYDSFLSKEASKMKLLQAKGANCLKLLNELDEDWEEARSNMLELIAERNAKKGVQ